MERHMVPMPVSAACAFDGSFDVFFFFISPPGLFSHIFFLKKHKKSINNFAGDFHRRSSRLGLEICFPSLRRCLPSGAGSGCRGSTAAGQFCGTTALPGSSATWIFCVFFVWFLLATEYLGLTKVQLYIIDIQSQYAKYRKNTTANMVIHLLVQQSHLSNRVRASGNTCMSVTWNTLSPIKTFTPPMCLTLALRPSWFDRSFTGIGCPNVMCTKGCCCCERPGMSMISQCAWLRSTKWEAKCFISSFYFLAAWLQNATEVRWLRWTIKPLWSGTNVDGFPFTQYSAQVWFSNWNWQSFHLLILWFHVFVSSLSGAVYCTNHLFMVYSMLSSFAPLRHQHCTLHCLEIRGSSAKRLWKRPSWELWCHLVWLAAANYGQLFMYPCNMPGFLGPAWYVEESEFPWPIRFTGIPSYVGVFSWCQHLFPSLDW